MNRSKVNLLTGWNFGLNPYQTQSAGSALTTASSQVGYIADQTILYQRAASLIKSGQASNAYNFGLQLQAVGAGSQVDNRLAIIQYMDHTTIAPYLGQNISCMVRAILANVNSVSVPIKMRLIYNTSLPADVSSTEPIASWTVGSDPTFSSNWTVIIPQNDPEYVLGNTFANSVSDFPQYAFDKFSLPSVSGGYFIGIVIYTMADLDNTMVSPNSIFFDRVSLVQNDFAIDSAQETYDESLRKCQFYYERSYSTGTNTGTHTFDSALSFRQLLFNNSGTFVRYPATFTYNFKQTKCQGPAISYYSPTSGNSGKIYTGFYANGAFVGSPGDVTASSNWGFVVDKEGTTGQPNTSSAIESNNSPQNYWDAVMYFHYTADARLGINNP